MLKLQLPENITEDILAIHLDTCHDSIRDGIDIALRNKYIGGYKVKKNERSLLSTIKDNLVDILIGEPAILDKIKNHVGSKDYNYEEKNINRNFFCMLLQNIFDYESFRDSKKVDWSSYSGNRTSKRKKEAAHWGAFEYIELLNIKSCPYCNRNYTITLDTGNKRIKPELDHFFNKAQYPFLALSLYNLIPSCTLCNSRLKGDKKFTWGKHLHPFVDSFHEHYVFKTSLDSTMMFNGGTDFDIKLTAREGTDSKKAKLAKENSEVFCLKHLYEHHKDYVSEIIVRAQRYNPDWLGEKLEKKLLISGEYPLRYFIGNFLKKEEINNRPLSKLTIDICKEFGIFLD